MNKDFIVSSLDQIIPNPKCELNYNKDYELLISTMLSAQSTDKRVNEVAKTLYKYNLEELSKLEIKDIEKIIMQVGTYHKKEELVRMPESHTFAICFYLVNIPLYLAHFFYYRKHKNFYIFLNR